MRAAEFLSLSLVVSVAVPFLMASAWPAEGDHAVQHVLAVADASLDGAVFATEPAWVTDDFGLGRVVPAWTYNASAVTMSSPRIADVDGDGVKDIVQATMGAVGNPYQGGRVYVFDRTGQALPGWPLTFTSPFTSSCPAIADLDGDGDMEIVAQNWSYTYVWNHDGTNYPGWPKSHGTGTSTSAALADLDNDGDLEIICPTGTKLNVWHHNGTLLPGWPFTAPKYVSPPAVADIDGDGELEIVAGCWEGPYPGTGPFPFYAWKPDGTFLTGFPIADPGGQTRGPISLGDLDGDGTIEIVARISDCIYVWNSQAQVQPGWPVCPDLIRNSATAIGDLDGDGDFEIVIGGMKVQAFHHNGTAVAGWPVSVPPGTGNIVAGLIIAELDGSPAQREVVVHSGDTFSALHANGTMLSGFPYVLSNDNQSTTFSPAPAVGDLDGNGQVEYFFVSLSGRMAFFDQPESYSGNRASWPVLQHDRLDTGYLPRFAVGDINCDGAIDFADINPFVLLLSDPAGYLQAFPDCGVMSGDCNGDGLVNFDDINPFVALLTGL